MGYLFPGETPRVPRGPNPHFPLPSATKFLPSPSPPASPPRPPPAPFPRPPVALPELEVAPGSRVLRLQGVRSQGSGGGTWSCLLCSQGLCRGTVLCLSPDLWPWSL